GSALSAEVTVMISGGFKAALESWPRRGKTNRQPPRGDPGPSMGKRRRRSLTVWRAANTGSALSAEVTVMISGGFKAALESWPRRGKTNRQP
ncbi:hypothetical protein CPA58_29225, partial [Klebsiella pneumoniae]